MFSKNHTFNSVGMFKENKVAATAGELFVIMVLERGETSFTTNTVLQLSGTL